MIKHQASFKFTHDTTTESLMISTDSQYLYSKGHTLVDFELWCCTAIISCENAETGFRASKRY